LGGDYSPAPRSLPGHKAARFLPGPHAKPTPWDVTGCLTQNLQQAGGCPGGHDTLFFPEARATPLAVNAVRRLLCLVVCCCHPPQIAEGVVPAQGVVERHDHISLVRQLHTRSSSSGVTLRRRWWLHLVITLYVVKRRNANLVICAGSWLLHRHVSGCGYAEE